MGPEVLTRALSSHRYLGSPWLLMNIRIPADSQAKRGHCGRIKALASARLPTQMSFYSEDIQVIGVGQSSPGPECPCSPGPGDRTQSTMSRPGRC